MNSRKRAFTVWANFRLKTKGVQLTNVFVELFRGLSMKQLVESITGSEIRKLNSWDNLSSAQQVTRIEWIVDELKDAEVLKNSFYCEFPALGRGAYDETEWFLWNVIKADIYRVFEYSLSYLEESSRLLNVPYSNVHTLEKPAPPKTKNLFGKTEQEIEMERRLREEERAAWRAKLKPNTSCVDLVVKYLSRIREGKAVVGYFNSLSDLKDTRVLLTFANSLFEDVFTPDIMLNDKWGVNLALEAIANILRIGSDFDSEDLATADTQAMCAYLACVFNKALEFKQAEKVVRRLGTIDEKLGVYNKELEEMSKISMSANESRQKKELVLKVEVLRKERERLEQTYDVPALAIWVGDAEAERRRVHAVVAYRLKQRFISEPIRRPVIISNLIDSQYINLSLTNGAAFYTTKARETVSTTRKLVLYDKGEDTFIDDFSGFRAPGQATVRELLNLPNNEIVEISSADYEDKYTLYYESLTRNRSLKPPQQFLYQLFPGSQIFLQKVYHKRVKVGDLLTVKKLIRFYNDSPDFVDSKDSLTENTALHLSVKHGHFHIALFLLEQTAQIEVRNKKGKTPFFIAAERSDRLMCKLLIEWGADVFTKNLYQKSVLEMMNNEKFRDVLVEHYQYIKQSSISVLSGNMEHLNKFVLDHKYKVNELSTSRSRCFEGMTCMHVAAKFGAIPVIEVLSEMGVSVRTTDRAGATPLHYVHDVPTCQVLIEKGANVNALDSLGDTPIHYLCSGRAGSSDNQIDVAEVLAHYGASLSIVNEMGYMPLHYCAVQGRADYIMLLMQDKSEEMRAILEEQVQSCSLPYLALHHDNLKCAQWLLSVDIRLIDEEATELLKELLLCTDRSIRSRTETAELLIREGANVNATYEESGEPLIHVTTESVETLELLTLLVKSGADVNAKNREGQTALFAAVKHRNIHAAKYLIENGAEKTIKDLHDKLPFQHLADFSEWISRSILDDSSESLLKQCSLNAERNLVRDIKEKLRKEEMKSRKVKL